MSTSQKAPENLDQLVRAVVEGRLQLHELPGSLPAAAAAEVRRRAMAEMRGTSLEHVGRYSLDAERAASRHCENFVGTTQIPLGISGPFKIQGERVSPEEEIYVPLATTEGALVASINRGCRALREGEEPWSGSRTWA